MHSVFWTMPPSWLRIAPFVSEKSVLFNTVYSKGKKKKLEQKRKKKAEREEKKKQSHNYLILSTRVMTHSLEVSFLRGGWGSHWPQLQ